MESGEIKKFYDEHADTQLRAGVNERHHAILRLAMDHGIARGTRVLEIGCGVGSFTGLLASKFPGMRILAVDISEAGIESARSALAGVRNVEFMVADVINDEIPGTFDMIILPDVLEHIPAHLRPRLFERMRGWLGGNGRILIHSPEPYFLEWIIAEKPELLQVVDLPLHLTELLPEIHAAGLMMHYFQRHNIWTDRPDYMAMVLIKVPVPAPYRFLPETGTPRQRVKALLKRIFLKDPSR
jgi:trans-aconitate 2-methyltransferase